MAPPPKRNRERQVPYRHPAALPEDALLEACGIGQGRSSGPGGQHRNKVQTQVTLTHIPTGIFAVAGERRSMTENRHVAARRLRLKLAVEHREEVPPGDIGSALWKSRVKPAKRSGPKKKDPDETFFEAMGVTLRTPEPETPTGRIVVNAEHWDYASLLAEALDAVAAAGWEPKPAAVRLGVSQSQLIKLIKDHPPALAKLNDERRARGLHPIK
jgi:hypothetical protein